MKTEPLLSIQNISKHYPGVEALKSVSLKLYAGEIKALVGENGAGKSTLIKIITGAESPSSGKIFFEGKNISSMTPALSDKLGIHCVYQNLELAPHLTVAENVWMGKLPSKRGLLKKKVLMGKTLEILDEIGYKDTIRSR